MQKKPFGAGLDFYDGQWYIPFGLLALSTLYGDIEWTKVVGIVMFVMAMFHIMYEHRIAFGKKDVGLRLLYNLGAFVLSVYVAVIMPVYMALSYAIFASKLKKDGEDWLLEKKKKTYLWMFLIMAFAMLVHTVQSIMIMDDIQATIQQQEQAKSGISASSVTR